MCRVMKQVRNIRLGFYTTCKFSGGDYFVCWLKENAELKFCLIESKYARILADTSDKRISR